MTRFHTADLGAPFCQTAVVSWASMKKPKHEQPKIGRPLRAAGASDARVTLRLTPEELAAWEQAAAGGEHPIKLSEWIRAACAAELARAARRKKG